MKDELDATFDRVRRIDHSELELRADFARYLCVLVSGFLEQSLRNATAEFARKRAKPVISNYVVKVTGRITNLNTNKLRDHLVSFDPSWQEKLDALIDDEAKDAIDSVVALRHRIVHGQSADVTVERIDRYYREITRAVTAIQRLMGVDS